MPYISVSEINTYLWLSWEDSLVSQLISDSENLINNFCKIDTFNQHIIENEEYDYRWNWPYLLKHSVIQSLNKINWITFSWEYRLVWRTLTFKSCEVININDTERNNILFTYTVWYSDIPDDLKSATKMIVSELYNNRKSEWVKEFSQWDLRIVFWKNSENLNRLFLLLWKYKKLDVYS